MLYRPVSPRLGHRTRTSSRAALASLVPHPRRASQRPSALRYLRPSRHARAYVATRGTVLRGAFATCCHPPSAPPRHASVIAYGSAVRCWELRWILERIGRPFRTTINYFLLLLRIRNIENGYIHLTPSGSFTHNPRTVSPRSKLRRFGKIHSW